MEIEIKGRLKSRELAEKICDLIVRNRLKEGDPILSENQLAAKFNLSRVTVRQSIANLVEQDILFKVKGKGTFVSQLHNLTRKDEEANGLGKTIALVTSSISNSYDSNIARGIEDAAREKDFHISFCSTDGGLHGEERAITRLLNSGIGGMIITPVESNPLSPFLQRTCREFDNIVIINDVVLGLNVDIVSSDDVEGGYLATKHLLEQGHRKIAHLRGPKLVLNAGAREEGYRKALNEFGIKPNENLIRGRKTYSEEEACSNMIKIMQLPEKERPTAVFAPSDHMAWGAYWAAEKLGLSVSENLAIVGYGNLARSAQQGYQLSSIKQNGYEVGHLSCKILLDNILDPDLQNKHHHKMLITPELIIRDSSLKHNGSEQ